MSGLCTGIDRGGRPWLLDLMEELRAPLADRFVLTLINTRVLQQKHFQTQVGWRGMADGRRAQGACCPHGKTAKKRKSPIRS